MTKAEVGYLRDLHAKLTECAAAIEPFIFSDKSDDFECALGRVRGATQAVIFRLGLNDRRITSMGTAYLMDQSI